MGVCFYMGVFELETVSHFVAQTGLELSNPLGSYAATMDSEVSLKAEHRSQISYAPMICSSKRYSRNSILLFQKEGSGMKYNQPCHLP